VSDPRAISALSALTDAYDAAAARERLAADVDRVAARPVLRRPRANTFRVYDPTRPVNPRRAGAVPASEKSPYVDAPKGEPFWLLLIGGLVLFVFAWLAWVTNTAI
jgi:hypothetical protein